MGVRGLFLSILGLFVALGFSFPIDKVKYRVGRGFRIETFRSTLGGYTTLSYESGKNYEEFKLDDIALLMYGDPLKRFRYFVEFELNDVYQVINGKERTRKKIDIERLYADFEINEAFKLRIGRFITPIGLWNPIHLNFCTT